MDKEKRTLIDLTSEGGKGNSTKGANVDFMNEYMFLRIDIQTIIQRYGQIEGAHHKAWVIDQIFRKVTTKEEYDAFRYEPGEDYDEGIAP